jgi:glycosyltransferase A (GT-A) superfamily protein (DUF2064 family)
VGIFKPSTNTDTAILFFSRKAETEALVKKITPQESCNTLLTSRLIQFTRQQIRNSGLPYFMVDETQQIGTTLANRLENAFQQIFDRGFERVIAIGNDCLEMSHRDLLQAATSLHSNSIVVGANTHGGLYLLGVCRESYQKIPFQSFSWQTNHLFLEFSTFCRTSMLSYEFLKPKSDLNTIQRKNTYYAKGQWSSIYKILYLILIRIKSYTFYSSKKLSEWHYAIYLFRGPPIPL